MVITEEIIAAYVEGKVSDAERKEVRRYLAVHPEMQDLRLILKTDISLRMGDNGFLPQVKNTENDILHEVRGLLKVEFDQVVVCIVDGQKDPCRDFFHHVFRAKNLHPSNYP